MDGFILLCDFAESIAGKLYIMGGGWSRLLRHQPVFDMSVAGKLFVPWDRAEDTHRVVIRLLDSNKAPVRGGNDERPVQLEGEMTLSQRVEGLKEGTQLDTAVAFRFQDLRLESGSYVWELLVNDELVADATFEVEVVATES